MLNKVFKERKPAKLVSAAYIRQDGVWPWGTQVLIQTAVEKIPHGLIISNSKHRECLLSSL